MSRRALVWLGAIAGLLMGALAAQRWMSQPSGADSSARAARDCELPPPQRGGDGAPAATPAGMVWIPGGRLRFGDSVYPEEGPITEREVAGFWMDRTEVTNDQFAQFVAATGYVTLAERVLDPADRPGLPAALRAPGAVVFHRPGPGTPLSAVADWWRYTPGAYWRAPGGPGTTIAGRGAYPVVALAYPDALAYARWKGRELPSELQWEWAAQGGQATPRASAAPPAGANTWQGLFPVLDSADDGFEGLAPVGCFPANAYGLHDMIGNVWELTADEYTPSHRFGPVIQAARAEGISSPAVPSRRVIKGGSYLCAANYCQRYRAGARQPQEDDLAASHIGFRTVLNWPPRGAGSDSRQ